VMPFVCAMLQGHFNVWWTRSLIHSWAFF
jgi:hypothetical protein